LPSLSEPSIASRIDHTLLKAFATEQDICKLCDEAHKYQFASVCVNPIYVRTASKYLRALGSSVKVCTVVGFPLGSTTTECKCFETMEAIANGADEIDMVMAIGMMKNGEYDYVRNEIDRIHTICKNSGKLLKVIIEICYLTDEEIEKASELTFQGGAEFVKTSTGFGPSSAKVEAVRIMAKVAKKYGGRVKAAGGIRSRADANAMIEAGADRLGTSSGVAIVDA
ncbi:hypothetical protein WA577_002852, partial [Blastocystis sp. JDR]